MPAAFDPRPAAQALAEAWREGAPISALPAPPRTPAQAEQVAFAMLAELDLAAVGFRAVARNDAAIITGPVVEARLLQSGVTVPTMLHAGTARAALLAPLAGPLPGGRGALDWAMLAPLLGPMRAALDLGAARVAGDDAVLQTADLGWLGLIVLAPARRNAAADAGALRVKAGDRTATLDARPLLLAAANAAQRAGGLPAGAALCVALPLAMRVVPDEALACRITGLGTAEMLAA